MSRGYCCFRSLLCLSHYLAPLHKMLDLWSYEEDTCIKPISSAGSTNHNIFWWHFCSHGIKNWKSGPKFFNFQSMSILVIILSQQVTGNSLNASIKYCCTFSKTCKFWSSKANWHFHFSLPSIILAELLGHRTWQVQKVMVCDWLFSIHFVCFCGSRLTAFDCNYDWRQQKKKQLWKWLWWALWKVQ